MKHVHSMRVFSITRDDTELSVYYTFEGFDALVGEVLESTHVHDHDGEGERLPRHWFYINGVQTHVMVGPQPGFMEVYYTVCLRHTSGCESEWIIPANLN